MDPNARAKPVEELAVEDFERSPVWELFQDESDDTCVRRVDDLPAKSLTSRLVGLRVRLKNGSLVWAIIGNVDVKSPKLTEHFLTLSIARSGEWFHLARYHDVALERLGSSALATFLATPIEEVFPISYDLTAYAIGDARALVGSVAREPVERMERAELMKLAATPR